MSGCDLRDVVAFSRHGQISGQFSRRSIEQIVPEFYAKIGQNLKVPKLKNQICGFVGNVYADSGLTCYPY